LLKIIVEDGESETMRDFNQFMGDYQTTWRAANLENQMQRLQNGHQRMWIMPVGESRKGTV